MVFRDGPSGRRAALVAGPDVWEVVAAIRAVGSADEDEAVALAAADLSLPAAWVRLALDYYGEFPDEVDSQIADNETAAIAAHAAFQARQRLFA